MMIELSYTAALSQPPTIIRLALMCGTVRNDTFYDPYGWNAPFSAEIVQKMRVPKVSHFVLNAAPDSDLSACMLGSQYYASVECTKTF